VLSIQGKTPLPGHPKTLRDLTHATELLTLPSSFGSIQLGETFTSCLCVNNEANADIDGVNMKVEMQTATSKILLSDFGGPDCRLAVGDTMENVVSHEIKELGQHVLACTVSYHSPENSPSAAGAEEVASAPESHTFRKFYKFAASPYYYLWFIPFLKVS
jgi:trafficking protein particle complex subunit 13